MEEFVKLNMGLTKQQRETLWKFEVPPVRLKLKALMGFIRLQKAAKKQLSRDKWSTAKQDAFIAQQRLDFQIAMRLSTLLRKGMVLKSDLDKYAKYGPGRLGQAWVNNDPRVNPLGFIIEKQLSFSYQHVFRNAIDAYLRGEKGAVLQEAPNPELKLSKGIIGRLFELAGLR